MARRPQAITPHLAPLDLVLNSATQQTDHGVALLPFRRPAVVVSPLHAHLSAAQTSYHGLKQVAVTLEGTATYVATQQGQRVLLGEPFIAASEGSISMARIIGAEVDRIVIAKEMKIPSKFVGSTVMSGHERVVANAVDLAHLARSPYAPLAVLSFDDSIVELLPVAAGHLGHVLAHPSIADVPSHRALVAHETMHQVAQQLDRVHKAGISHRDVALKNILFSFHGDLGLADFGLAAKSHALTHASFSLEYAAPEVLRRALGGVFAPYHGPAADMWSLGVSVATLVVGAMPFAATNPKATEAERYRAVTAQHSAWGKDMVQLWPWLVAGAGGPRPTLSTSRHEAFVAALMAGAGPLGATVLELLQPVAAQRPCAASVVAGLGRKSSAGQGLSLAALLAKIPTAITTQVAMARLFGASADATRADPQVRGFVRPAALTRRHTTGDLLPPFDPDHDLKWEAVAKEVAFWRSYRAADGKTDG